MKNALGKTKVCLPLFAVVVILFTSVANAVPLLLYVGPQGHGIQTQSSSWETYNDPKPDYLYYPVVSFSITDPYPWAWEISTTVDTDYSGTGFIAVGGFDYIIYLY